jgi:hypothetical protein
MISSISASAGEIPMPNCSLDPLGSIDQTKRAAITLDERRAISKVRDSESIFSGAKSCTP